MKLRQLLLILTGLFIFLSIQSCSLHIEKRRYRKGYHIDIVGNPSKTKVQIIETPQAIQHHFPEENSEVDSFQYAKRDLIPIPSQIHSKKTFIPGQFAKPAENKSPYRKFGFKRNPKQVNHAKTINSVKTRRTIAWILGGIAIFLALAYLILGFIFMGPYGAFVYMVGLIIAALFLAIVALIVRYVGVKKDVEREKTEPPKKLGKGFFNAGFYMAIASVALGLAGFLSGFLLSSLSFLLPIIFGTFGLITAITAFCFGIVGLKDDPTPKSKVTIIVALIGLVLSILAIVFLFI
jgi:hypothetical protein